jgi:hypothetical protein
MTLAVFELRLFPSHSVDTNGCAIDLKEVEEVIR